MLGVLLSLLSRVRAGAAAVEDDALAKPLAVLGFGAGFDSRVWRAGCACWAVGAGEFCRDTVASAIALSLVAGGGEGGGAMVVVLSSTCDGAG